MICSNNSDILFKFFTVHTESCLNVMPKKSVNGSKKVNVSKHTNKLLVRNISHREK